ncbi:MAG: putative sulfate exporter family transporter, partial [Cytophagales bacterium]|nr:putative sulfate exporter family transporter [Cytophagales bacterium]
MKSPLFRSEDYWAIWLGLFLLLFTSVLIFASSTHSIQQRLGVAQADLLRWEQQPVRSWAYYQALLHVESIRAETEPVGSWLKDFWARPRSWKYHPSQSFYLDSAQAEVMARAAAPQLAAARHAESRARLTAQSLERSASKAAWAHADLNAHAAEAARQWVKAHETLQTLEKKKVPQPFFAIPYLLGVFLVLGSLFGLGHAAMHGGFSRFFRAFVVVFGLALLAHFLAAQQDVKNLGMGYTLWGAAAGPGSQQRFCAALLVAPGRCKTEFLYKTALVLFGAELLLGKVLAIGIPGLFVAWVVTPVVLVATFWFGQRVLQIASPTLNMTISADMSVCGVSAAVATAAACGAKKEELTLAIGLSMFFTSVMMLAMPAFIKAVGMPEVLGGAWLGGTLDATG